MEDVVLPPMGESVQEGTITKWLKAVGDTVAEDEPLFEVSTDKVDSEVPSPISGVLVEIVIPEGGVVEVGGVVARFGEKAPPENDSSRTEVVAEVSPSGAATSTDEEPKSTPEQEIPPSAQQVLVSPQVTADESGELAKRSSVFASPLVARIARNAGISLEQMTGTGPDGRITRADIEEVIKQRNGDEDERLSAYPPMTPAMSATADKVNPDTGSQDLPEVEPFSKIRKITAEHMVRSVATSPHAMTAVEVHYDNVDKVRKQRSGSFKEEEGFSLTYLPFISRAVVDALKKFPRLNGSIADEGFLYHNRVNLSIAVDLNFEGLVAPVVKNAEDFRLEGLARSINDLAVRARTKKLSADDLSGGTFTISNSGSYGTHMVIPIINQPQVAILSTDGISRKPVVVTIDGSESIAIRSVGILAMSWDHRAFDGAYAAAFLKEVKNILETRDWSVEL